MSSCLPGGVLNRNDRATTNEAIPIKIGDSFRAQTNESFLTRISLTIILNIKKAMIRLKTGDYTQLSTTAASLVQLMTEKPPAMIPKPIIAPTIEWVVETGNDFQVAKLTQRAAASKAEKAPIRATCGSDMISVDTIPLRMVSVTCEPMKTAPRIFRIPAINTAWRMVIAFAPTAEAMELATSLAPMFHAI